MRKDVRVVQNLARELGEALEEYWKMGFVPYSQSGKGDKFEELREDCDCSGIDDPSVGHVPAMSEIEDTVEFRPKPRRTRVRLSAHVGDVVLLRGPCLHLCSAAEVDPVEPVELLAGYF